MARPGKKGSSGGSESTTSTAVRAAIVSGIALVLAALVPVLWSWRSQTKEHNTEISTSSRTTSASVLEKPQSADGLTSVEFGDVDTSGAPGHELAAGPHLHKFGISVGVIDPPTSKVLISNNDTFYDGNILNPHGTQNVLTQRRTDNTAAAFTLNFTEPLDEFIFTRPAMFASTKSGLTYPAWRAAALDAGGNVLSVQSEELTRSYRDVPAATYSLRAPGFAPISAVRFESDPRLEGSPFAAFNAVVIERIKVRPTTRRE